MSYVIHHSDALDALRAMPSDHFSGLLSDPPSGISFMGAEWDSDKGGRDEWIAWLEEIMREALRVLKPGARGLVWALPRTSHWTGMALERAGFVVIDVVQHLFGNGYPKALSLERAVSMKTCPLPGRHFPGRLPKGKKALEGDHRCPMTTEGARWVGHFTALKPSAEFWWFVMKPIDGTFAENALKHGTGSFSVDDLRIGDVNAEQVCGRRDSAGECMGHESSGRLGLTYHRRPASQDELDRGGAFAAALDDVRMGEPSASSTYEDAGSSDFAMTPGPRGGDPKGRWPSHTLLSHNDDCVPVGTKTVAGHKGYPNGPGGHAAPFSRVGDSCDSDEPWAGHPSYDEPAYACSPGCPVAGLDEQSGERPGMSGGGQHAAGYEGGMFGSIDSADTARGDTGGASRFFATFAPKKDDEYECSPGCPVAALDEQSGVLTSGRIDGSVHTRHTPKGWSGEFEDDNGGPACRGVFGGDSGGASRFLWCAKPSKTERELGCEALPLRTAGEVTGREDGSDGLLSPRAGAGRTSGNRNDHTTLKSVRLARRLATMIKPPPRVDGEPRRLLNIFSGSGTEGIGALRAGWEHVECVEKDEHYVEIAQARFAYWLQVPASLDDERDVIAAAEKPAPGQTSLFGVPR